MKRRGIGYALVMLFLIIFAVGIIWIGLYYGGILPIYNKIVAGYGASIFDSNDIAFVLTVCAFWLFICTIAFFYYLFNQSQKRDLTYG